jgi:hypothetical protein
MKKLKSYVILKSGLIKSYYFSDDFIKENESLYAEFVKLWETLFDGVCDMWSCRDKNKDNAKIKELLCDLLDKLFDKSVKIENGSDNKRYNSKKMYRKYITDYNLNTA